MINLRGLLLLGKSEIGMPSGKHNHQIDTPSQEAKRISAFWRESVLSLLNGCERIYLVLDSLDRDEPRQTQFIAGLVKGGVLTEKEGKLGVASPKLSKLRTIGQHADILKRKGIASYLTPEYSVLYQLCVFYKKTPADDEKAKIKRVESVVSSCSGELSREYLAFETKRLKRQKQKKRPSIELEEGAAPKQVSLPNLISQEQTFDLILVTPTKIDITFLAAQYEANSLEECLPLFKLVDHSSPAGLVIITSIANLTIVETKLLPLCGFSSISHVVLTDEPQSADITDSPIIVFAVKGTKLKPQFPKKGTWFKIGHERINEVDAIEAAKATFPSLGKRLHVFAERPSDGWSSLIGEKSWVELPSLK